MEIIIMVIILNLVYLAQSIYNGNKNYKTKTEK